MTFHLFIIKEYGMHGWFSAKLHIFHVIPVGVNPFSLYNNVHLAIFNFTDILQ